MIRSTRRAERVRQSMRERERKKKKNITSASLELERECIVTQLNVANSRFPQKQGRLPHRLFPPRTGCVWGDNWRVPWHAARERALHSATHSHTKLGSFGCVRVRWVCMAKQQSGRECVFMFMCVYMCVDVSLCAYVWCVFIREGGGE